MKTEVKDKMIELIQRELVLNPDARFNGGYYNHYGWHTNQLNRILMEALDALYREKSNELKFTNSSGFGHGGRVHPSFNIIRELAGIEHLNMRFRDVIIVNDDGIPIEYETILAHSLCEKGVSYKSMSLFLKNHLVD